MATEIMEPFGPTQVCSLLEQGTSLPGDGWLLRDVDKQGEYVSDLDDLVRGCDPDAPSMARIWNREIRAQWNENSTAAVVPTDHINHASGEIRFRAVVTDGKGGRAACLS